MNILLSVITLIFVLSVVSLFAHDDKEKSGNVTYLWDLDATTPVAPSSKNWDSWISDMEEIGFDCIIKSGNVTHSWDLDATTPVVPSSKNWNSWISDMEKIGFECIKKSGNVTYLWDLDATTPVVPSSKNWNSWISSMEEIGFESTIKRIIPLSEALENNTEPIDEVLLARSRGCYSICAVFENDSIFSPAFYFVSEKDILLVVFVLTK